MINLLLTRTQLQQQLLWLNKTPWRSKEWKAKYGKQKKSDVDRWLSTELSHVQEEIIKENWYETQTENAGIARIELSGISA